jgi:PhnB protein
MSTTKIHGIVESYLNFDGRCEEAIEFYRRALGAEVEMLMRFKDNPEPAAPGCAMPGTENKVMHASLRIGESKVNMSDGRCTGKTAFQGISLALTLPNEAEATQCFNALANGGQIGMPLGKTFFSPAFGMVTDKFGVTWMVLVRS